jgi:hypothetical protein
MEEYPCTMNIRHWEAQGLPQLAQCLLIYAKTSPLRGMMSSSRDLFFCKIKFECVKGKIRRSESLICGLP